MKLISLKYNTSFSSFFISETLQHGPSIITIIIILYNYCRYHHQHRHHQCVESHSIATKWQHLRSHPSYAQGNHKKPLQTASRRTGRAFRAEYTNIVDQFSYMFNSQPLINAPRHRSSRPRFYADDSTATVAANYR